LAISPAQCPSIVVGSPELSTGISLSVAELHQINRLVPGKASCQLWPVRSRDEQGF
jgi:hypothetical protein